MCAAPMCAAVELAVYVQYCLLDSGTDLAVIEPRRLAFGSGWCRAQMRLENGSLVRVCLNNQGLMS